MLGLPAQKLVLDGQLADIILWRNAKMFFERLRKTRVRLESELEPYLRGLSLLFCQHLRRQAHFLPKYPAVWGLGVDVFELPLECRCTQIAEKGHFIDR